jgi:hypothetical protein
LYDSFIDEIDRVVGPIANLTVADVGTCCGYFPISFARRGARRSVGFDAADYSPTFGLLNEICGTKAEFIHRAYDGPSGKIPGADVFDVVVSSALLVHLSDPLHHLAFLGSIARKALLVWTYTDGVEGDDMLTIRYHAANRFYSTPFPYCFDIVSISAGLLQKSLELLGFKEIHRLRNPGDNALLDYWFKVDCGYLAVR